MCDKELLLAYLYDELPPSDRQAFDRHLGSCVDCRDEVEGLRGTRTHLLSWAPPEPDLGFQIVRSAKPAAPPRARWRASPAGALRRRPAHARRRLGRPVANVEVEPGATASIVRTGWNRARQRSAPQSPVVLVGWHTSTAEVQRGRGAL